ARRAGVGRALAILLAATIALAAMPAARAHHVGAYVPRDNEVSANFKQIKFSLQAQKYAVALSLYDGGALGGGRVAPATPLPRGLDASTGAALPGADAPAAETGLMLFFAVLVRALALEADRRLADASAPAAARVAGGGKI